MGSQMVGRLIQNSVLGRVAVHFFLTIANYTGYHASMRTKKKKFRWLNRRLADTDARTLIVITGARQTGKTTLVRLRFPALPYYNLDAIEERESLAALRTRAWAGTVGPAVLDEAQKEPSVFEKVKWAFDEGEIDFSVLTGSSRILLLSKVRETLAGRAFLYDLWPLMASELRCDEDHDPVFPLIHRIITENATLNTILSHEPPLLLGPNEELRRSAIEHLTRWGGMPGLLPFEPKERHEWLRSYQQTFLERDLADLVRLRDLAPFRILQRLAMLRSGGLLSFSELARDAGIAVNTARRFVEYLRISYQTILLQPWFRNLTSQVVKTPKLYWLDIGLLRQGTRQWGPITGEMFETLVVGEIHKWISTMLPDTGMYFYRTRSGMEVDLILETDNGLVGVEIKSRPTVAPVDTKSLRAVAVRLGKEWRGGLVVYNGSEISRLSKTHSLWAVPLHRLV